MREQGWIRKAERPRPPLWDEEAHGQLRRCAVEGCDNMVFDSEICEDCEEGRDALKWMLVNTPRDYTILPAARPATRLEDFAWATAAITLFLYLLWSLRGWWIEWFEMWLHSGS